MNDPSISSTSPSRGDLYLARKRRVQNYTLKKWYHFKNIRRPRVLLYTDSRGLNMELTKVLGPSAFDLYPGQLIREYRTDTFLMPHRYTTLIDFIDCHEKLTREGAHFDYVIAQIGIVDFSPRKQSSASIDIYQRKKDSYDRIFGEKKMADHLQNALKVEYEGERTQNMFSPTMMIEHLVPHLQAIPNFIWIGCNRLLPEWRGTYFRERPANVNLVWEYSKTLRSHLPRTVPMEDWSDEEIMTYTTDNLHLSAAGSSYILSALHTYL